MDRPVTTTFARTSARRSNIQIQSGMPSITLHLCPCKHCAVAMHCPLLVLRDDGSIQLSSTTIVWKGAPENTRKTNALSVSATSRAPKTKIRQQAGCVGRASKPSPPSWISGGARAPRTSGVF